MDFKVNVKKGRGQKGGAKDFFGGYFMVLVQHPGEKIT